MGAVSSPSHKARAFLPGLQLDRWWNNKALLQQCGHRRVELRYGAKNLANGRSGPTIVRERTGLISSDQLDAFSRQPLRARETAELCQSWAPDDVGYLTQEIENIPRIPSILGRL